MGFALGTMRKDTPLFSKSQVVRDALVAVNFLPFAYARNLQLGMALAWRRNYNRAVKLTCFKMLTTGEDKRDRNGHAHCFISRWQSHRSFFNRRLSP
jgi:hypothetical protein